MERVEGTRRELGRSGDSGKEWGKKIDKKAIDLVDSSWRCRNGRRVGDGKLHCQRQFSSIPHISCWLLQWRVPPFELRWTELEKNSFPNRKFFVKNINCTVVNFQWEVAEPKKKKLKSLSPKSYGLDGNVSVNLGEIGWSRDNFLEGFSWQTLLMCFRAGKK